MSKGKTKIEIEICSNCKSHQWCTRHNEATYSSLAMEIQKTLKSHDDSIDVQIFQVGGHKMGSFQITCNGTLLFSKLHLGYFPHVPSATNRILSFIDDSKNGRDLKKYSETNVSPHKSPNNSGGSFGGGSPKKEGKKIKYVPDYKQPGQQSQSFVMQSKPEAQAHKQKPKAEQKHDEKSHEPKKQTKAKEDHHENKKAEQKHHETTKQEPKKQEKKKTEQHKIEHEKHDKNQHHQPKKADEHKKAEENKKTEQHKKNEEHKQETSKQQKKKPEQHKQAPKKQEPHQQFIMDQNKGDQASAPHKQQAKKAESEKKVQHEQPKEKKVESSTKVPEQPKPEAKGEQPKAEVEKVEHKAEPEVKNQSKVSDGYEEDFEAEGKNSSIVKNAAE